VCVSFYDVLCVFDKENFNQGAGGTMRSPPCSRPPFQHHEEMPAYEVPTYEVPAHEEPVYEVLVQEMPVYEVPVPAHEVPVYEVPAHEMPAYDVYAHTWLALFACEGLFLAQRC
jgi:hypothetical protein